MNTKQNESESTQSTNPIVATEKNDLLTADEKIILSPLSQDADEKTLQKYGEALNKLAVKANRISLNNCKASPLVTKAKSGSEIQIVNVGGKEESYTIMNSNETKDYTLNPNTPDIFTPKLDTSSITYTIFCNNPSKTAGMILVTE